MLDNLHFMCKAIEEAIAAKDSFGQVGALLVHNCKIISSAGSDEFSGTHAEQNAISKLNDFKCDQNTIIYVTYSPCLKRSSLDKVCCSDLIVQAGIGKVIYGAVDPLFGKDKTEEYLMNFGVRIDQIAYSGLVSICQKIFDSSFKKS